MGSGLLPHLHPQWQITPHSKICPRQFIFRSILLRAGLGWKLGSALDKETKVCCLFRQITQIISGVIDMYVYNLSHCFKPITLTVTHLQMPSQIFSLTE